MNEITYNAILFAAAGCAIIIVVFALRAWKGRSKSIYVSGSDWDGKKKSFYWDTKR